MGMGTGDKAETREEEEDDDEQDDFESQTSLNSSNQDNDAYTKRETASMDRFGVVRTISKTTNGSKQSGVFVTMTNLEVQPGKNRNTGPCDPPADPEVDYEETSRQRSTTRVSTSTKLPASDRVTTTIVTPLVDNGASIEEAWTNLVDSIGEQNEQMSLSLREEMNRNHQEVSRSEKRLKEKTDEHLAKNLLRMTREAEQRELRLRDDIEKLRIQQKQTLETFDMKIDVMMESRTQAIMDRLDWLLGNRSGSKNGDTNSGEPNREPRMNFNEQPNRRRTYGATKEGTAHPAMPQMTIGHGAQTS